MDNFIEISFFFHAVCLDINWETLKTRDAPIVPNTQIVYEKKESFSIDPFLFSGNNENEVYK